MIVKLKRDKYIVKPDGSDSVGREGEDVDVDKTTAEAWIRRGHAEKTTDKKAKE
jgi:hypothetical protein